MDVESVALIKEIGAMTIIGIAVLASLRWAIPALFAYIKEKDIAHRTEMTTLIAKHQADIMTLITSSREERDKFYAELAIKLERIHDRLDKLTQQQKGTLS